MRFLLPLIWALQLLTFANEDFLTGPSTVVVNHQQQQHGSSSSANSSTRLHQQNASVAIIGAGFAGLSAFRRLAGLGFTNVHLFEGSTRVGGRVFPLEYDGIFLQQGAEFINGRNNPIFAMADRMRLIVDEVEDRQLLSPDGGATFASAEPDCAVPPDKMTRFAEFSAELESRYAQMATTSPALWNLTIGELFERDFAEFLRSNGPMDEQDRGQFEGLARMYRSYYEGEWAAPVDKLALHNYAIWRDSQAFSFSSFTLNSRGYATILEELIDGIPTDRLHLESRVQNINYANDNGIRIRINNEEWPQKFDFVIVTVPIGHLKHFAPVLFTPPLPPAKVRAIQAIGFGAMQKVFLIYERPFWAPNMRSLIGLNCANNNGTVDAALHTMQPHPWKQNILVIWLSGDGPKVTNALSDQQLGRLATEHLQKMLPDRAVPFPKRIIRTNWLSDELFLGSYSFITPEASGLSGDPFSLIAAPVWHRGVPRLLFAGEGTHSKMFQTTVGAMLSGQREAHRVAKLMGIGTTSMEDDQQLCQQT